MAYIVMAAVGQRGTLQYLMAYIVMAAVGQRGTLQYVMAYKVMAAVGQRGTFAICHGLYSYGRCRPI
jgi:hypothetical protein